MLGADFQNILGIARVETRLGDPGGRRHLLTYNPSFCPLRTIVTAAL
jgi:hypothetical protein